MFFQLFRCVRVIFIYKAEALRAAQIIHDLFGGSIQLVFFQGIDLSLSVDIGLKTVQCEIRGVEGIFPVLIHHNVKGGVQGLAVGLQNLHQGIGHIIEGQVFLPVGVIGPVILQYNGIGQLVMSKKLAVPVTDISAGALDGTCFCGAQIKVVGVFVSLYDL